MHLSLRSLLKKGTCFVFFLFFFALFEPPGRKNKKKLVKGGREESKNNFIFGVFCQVAPSILLGVLFLLKGVRFFTSSFLIFFVCVFLRFSSPRAVKQEKTSQRRPREIKNQFYFWGTTNHFSLSFFVFFFVFAFFEPPGP